MDAAEHSAAEGDGKKPGKAKLSRKERAKLQKEAKRQERKAGSDDEDLAADAPAFKVANQSVRPRCMPLLTNDSEGSLSGIPPLSTICTELLHDLLPTW